MINDMLHSLFADLAGSVVWYSSKMVEEPRVERTLLALISMLRGLLYFASSLSSMVGYGAWDSAIHYPGLIVAAVPI